MTERTPPWPDDGMLWGKIWRYATATNTINYRQIGWALNVDWREVRRLTEEHYGQWKTHPLIDWSGAG